jgi:hypothetical protein
MRIQADQNPDPKHWEIVFKNTEAKGYFNEKICQCQALIIPTAVH